MNETLVYGRECKGCGNPDCAADKCTLAALRIMMECGGALVQLNTIHKVDHFQPRPEIKKPKCPDCPECNVCDLWSSTAGCCRDESEEVGDCPYKLAMRRR